MLIGVISDTHGLVHPGVFKVFQGVDHILHAGDIGSEEVLIELKSLAPVTAIHGNADPYDIQGRYASQATCTLDGVTFLLHHQALDGKRLIEDVKKKAEDMQAQAVIFGHSHVAFSKVIDGVLFFNPGGGGKKRFSLPRSVGVLRIGSNGALHPSLRLLEP